MYNFKFTDFTNNEAIEHAIRKAIIDVLKKEGIRDFNIGTRLTDENGPLELHIAFVFTEIDEIEPVVLSFSMFAIVEYNETVFDFANDYFQTLDYIMNGKIDELLSGE